MKSRMIHINGIPCRLEVTREDNGGWGTKTPHIGFTFFDDKGNYHAGWIPKVMFEQYPDWNFDNMLQREMKLKRRNTLIEIL
jgi:hypothetical protein